MTTDEFEDALEELSSAEDFLDYFNIEFDQKVVHVNRLHILQRFNDYLVKGEAAMPENAEAKYIAYASLLKQAYQDFVESDALTEKVFKVFRMNEPQETFISIDQITK